MKKNEGQKYWIYICSLDEWDAVPKEVHDEHNKFYDAYRHRMQNRDQCTCPRQKWWYCDSDCVTCKYRRNETELSLDESVEDEDGIAVCHGDILVSPDRPVHDLVADRMEIELAICFARKTDPVVEQAIRLWQEDSSLSVVKVAESIGIPRMTLSYKLNAFRRSFKRKFHK